ncbi:MAG: alginate lyase family protein [Cyclobacteriaceae bacterium]
MKYASTILIILVLASCAEQKPQESKPAHPNLILTVDGVEAIQSNLGTVPLFDKTLEQVISEVDAEIEKGIDVPVPKDLAGGYTHERHKANFFIMQKAGVLFQITQEEKYAIYIRDMLLEYADIYPTLGKHPAERSYARGKFFWQCLNDANWLVYTSQAYDCIYSWLDEETVSKLNTELFRPYADYISLENPKFFNRLHNHSTWGNAGVGMIGLVMDDEELIDRALYAFDIDAESGLIDNDGGSLNLQGYKEGGFLAQINHSFSPDGYYTEGPYYQRYAMYPFLIFSQGLATKMPKLGILDYRDGLLIKAVYALIDQTNEAGEFFPINDAQKGMSLMSRELVHAIGVAYHYGSKDESLLSIIESQGKVRLSEAGLSAAKGIAEGKAKTYVKASRELRDGADGDEGAIGILRAKDLTLAMKYAKHGMGHGHFDRLSFLLYKGGEEVIQDYGAARWVNIEHKDGGGYLKENHSWAKQTVAHNTLVVDKKSHFDGNVKEADKTHGETYLFNTKNPELQVVSARETNAYDDISMQRTMAIVTLSELDNPLILDLFYVENEGESDYDLSYYPNGHLMSSSVPFTANDHPTPFAEGLHGYQHLWNDGVFGDEGKIDKDNLSVTWFGGTSFLTIRSALQEEDKARITRIGAKDPLYNLRRDPGFMISRKSKSSLFAQIIEVHGVYNPADEIPINSFTSVTRLKVLHESKEYAVVEFQLINGDTYVFAISQLDDNENSMHRVDLMNEKLEWKGAFHFSKK